MIEASIFKSQINYNRNIHILGDIVQYINISVTVDLALKYANCSPVKFSCRIENLNNNLTKSEVGRKYVSQMVTYCL